jgi:hypothetical protein
MAGRRTDSGEVTADPMLEVVVLFNRLDLPAHVKQWQADSRLSK